MEYNLILEGGSDEPKILGPNTLVFCLDETGHEEFLDSRFPVFGIGGCGFMVSDYRMLIEIPFNYMCEQFFPEVERPFHTSEVSRNITPYQIDSLNYLFRNFQFFRIATIVNQKLQNTTDLSVIQIVSNILVQGIVDIAQIASFDRIMVIYEDSERIGIKVMRAMSDQIIVGGKEKIKIELCLMPKRSGFVGLELADIIIHTAGRQGNHYLSDQVQILPDFDSVFRRVDRRLVSFRQFDRADQII